MSLIQCEDVTKLYIDPRSGIQVVALRGINLTLNEGDFVSVIGPSASGKTTLIRLLGGIERATTGTIIFGELDYAQLKRRDMVQLRRKEVGFLHQFPEENLLMNLSARDNVLIPMEILGRLGRRERLKKARELLYAVGLGDREHHPAGKLSGGEAQRLGLAVALANEPRLLLADEPTGELDSSNTFKLLDYLWELNEELGTTMIVVTHDRRFAERTMVSYQIRDGQIIGILRTKDPERLRYREKTVREELGVVDPFGNIRIPEKFRKAINLRTHVHVSLEDDRIVVRPAKEESSRETEEEDEAK